MTKKQMIFDIIAHTDKQGLSESYIEKESRKVTKGWVSIIYKTATSPSLLHPDRKYYEDANAAFDMLLNALCLTGGESELFTF